MTHQSLDAVVALVPVKLTDEMKLAALRPEGGCLVLQRDSTRLKREYAAMLAAAPDWHPTPEAINALPQPLRDYIHTIQTSHPSYDNAVKIRLLEEKVAMLERALGEESARLDFIEVHGMHVALDCRKFERDQISPCRAGIDAAMAALPEPPQSEER